MSTFLKVRKYGGPILLALIVTSAVTSYIWFRGLSEGTGKPPEPEKTTVASQAQMVTRNFRHVETRLNRTVWIIEAAAAEMFEKRARLQRVKITYFDDKNRPVIITGRKGRVDLETLDALLLGDVRILSHDGAVLKTRQLEWDNEEQTLTAPWPVRLRNGDFEVRGRRMTVMVDQNRVRVQGGVRTIVRSAKDFMEPSS